MATGAEAIAIVQLIDACIGITDTIIKIGSAVKDAQGLPPKLKELWEKLPAIEELLSEAHKNCEESKVSESACESAKPVLQQCEKALAELRDIFRKACPKDTDNRGKLLWKGIRTVFIGRESKVQPLLVVIQENLRLLGEKELYYIGNKLDELQQITEELSHEDASTYAAYGTGSIFATSGGSSTNYVHSGQGNMINAGTYNAHGPTYLHQPAERPETPPQPSSNVPFRHDNHFIQRPALTDQIHSKLSQPGRTAALVGLGGLGKSQLAIAYALGLSERSPETWVFWIHASNVTRFEQSLRDVANLVKLKGRQDPNANIPLLLQSWLRDKSKGEWLLILDNADDPGFLIGKPAESNDEPSPQRRIDYFPSPEHGSMLITSRSKNAALEIVQHDSIIDVQTMSEDEAEKLLDNKLGRSGPDNRMLAVELECIPLAISQAAAYILKMESQCSVAEYLDRIQQSTQSRTSLLRRDNPDPSRDREASNSIVLTWQISFEYIHREERSAAYLLGLMSFCDRVAIPELLLLADLDDEKTSEASSEEPSYRSHNRPEFDDDIATLRSFSFIADTATKGTWEMHRLVQNAMQFWLDAHEKFSKVYERFIYCLDSCLPFARTEDWPVCRTLYPHAEAIAGEKPSSKQALLEWASIMYKSSVYADTQGNYDEALAMANASADIRREKLGENDIRTALSLHTVAIALSRKKKLIEAEAFLNKAADISKSVLGENHEETMRCMGDLSLILRSQGRWKEAEVLQKNVLTYRKTAFGEMKEETLRSMFNLALIIAAQKRWKEAEEVQVRTLTLCRSALGDEHVLTIRTMVCLAYNHGSQGRWREAQRLSTEAAACYKKISGPQHLDTPLAMVINELFQEESREPVALMPHQEVELTKHDSGQTEQPQSHKGESIEENKRKFPLRLLDKLRAKGKK